MHYIALTSAPALIESASLNEKRLAMCIAHQGWL